VLIAVIISVIAAGRYSNVLDYVGPNLTSTQLVLYTPTRTAGDRPANGAVPAPTKAQLEAMGRTAGSIAATLGSHDVVELFQTGTGSAHLQGSATLQHAAPGRNFTGPVYVATPQLLRSFGIKSSNIDPAADILTIRPGLATISDMQLVYGKYYTSGSATFTSFPCPKSKCLANPVIEEVTSLPAGTSAPNTVITEHAVHQLHLSVSPAGWLIQTPHALTASQIADARLTAASLHMAIETRSSEPSSADIIDWATVFGIALALGILAMSVGLIRSETASDLRTLAATGAGRRTRRTLTAATAGGLGLLGALIGTACGYVACIGWYRSTHSTGLGALAHVPTTNLLLLVVGMPVLAALVGWVLSGHEPSAVAHQPME
jgi:putative ABC transport system permease protein